jgi:predicted metal-dependent phosphoesterase TrpH
MRCDLHVHSRFSGPVSTPVLGRVLRECYSEPRAVHETARRRGMDLVTLTDHDSIEGALELAGRPDFIVGEEVTCALGGGRVLHVGVYGIDEPQHQQIARRRLDAESLFAYLAEQRIPAALNHPFSVLTGPREAGDLVLGLAGLPLLEARNGMLPPSTNAAARQAGMRHGHGLVGGSDAHTLATVGRAWTVVRGARDRAEFLDGLRRRTTLAAGHSGTWARMTADILRIVGGGLAQGCRDLARGVPAPVALLAAALPLTALVPLATLVQFVKEHRAATTLPGALAAALAPRRPAFPAVAVER